MSLDQIFVGEYSVEQNLCHIEDLSTMCSINKKLILEGTFIDYLPIAVGTYTEVKEKLDNFKEELEEREEEK